MSGKFYVVAESDLETLTMTTVDVIKAGYEDGLRKVKECIKLANKAQEACRVREVELVDIYYPDTNTGELYWKEIKK